MFGSWKKILEYLELVFELLTQSKAELEALKSIDEKLTLLEKHIACISMNVISIEEAQHEKER